MNRQFWIPLALVGCALTASATAQDNALDMRRDQGPRVTEGGEGSLGYVTPTPEMWFYQQERERSEDPKQAVRRRAELRGQQRQERLAACKWYGIDNSRPTVSPTPYYGGYSPHWASNTYDPFRWRPTTAPMMVMRPTERY